MARALIIAFIASLAIAGVAAQRKWNTNAGPVAGKLNVHLVPHTHNDVGWLKTVDQYFYGANNTIQNAGVQYIIDSVIAGLQQNPDRKFIYVETGFFARWWREQTPEMQAGVQVLVDNGQLTFINGGWAMHDEASPHYHSMVDQTTFGHQFLLQELGAVPKAGWQIDPFGHSGTQAALLTAEVGFDSLYFARNDYQDYAQRLITQNLEMVWQGSHSLGSSARAFTGVFYGNTYCAPSGFDYNIFGQDPPIMDDPNLEDYNVQQRVDAFVAYVKQQNDGFKTDNIILTMGCDFQYQDALHWYKNLDKLIHYVNLDGRVNAFYSTPDIYTQSKFAANTTWQLKTDDFMPIASGAHSYWTGYFTSRPTLKRWSRHNVQYYPLVRQIAAAANFTNSSVWEPLLDAIGLSSHHDAITGTEKQHVAFDYAKHLSAGRSAVLPTVSKGIDLLIGNSANGNWQECVLANVSVCSLTQNFGINGTEAGGSFRVLLWNPSSQIRMHTVKIPVAGSTLTVTSPAGSSVPAEVVPSSPSFTNYATGSGAPYTLVFEASIAPLGHAVYTITEGATANTWQGVQYSQTKMVEPTPVGAGDISLTSTYYTLTFSGTTGKLTGIKNLIDGTTQSMTQDWLYYASMANNGQNSGAYIFRPNSTSAYPVGPTVSNDQLVQGALVQSIRQTFGPWVQQTIRLYRTSPLIEVEYTVGAIDISDGVGKEVISRFTTNIQSNSQWWVDSNGRDMQYRRRNWRQSWNYTMYEPITGNYYPTVTNLFINDSNAQLTVFTETSQSTSSILDGSVELMAHRRVLHDDNLGVGEPLNETEFISTYDNCNGPMGCGTHYGPGLIHRSKYWLTLTASKTAAQTWRPALDQIFYEPQQFYSDDATSGIQLPIGSLLGSSLPVNVQVMTLERVNASTILLRLSHQFGAGEDSALSAPVQVDLSTLFSAPGLHFVSYVEMSLTANQFKANMKPLNWNIEGGDTYTQPYRPADVGSLVSLSAMQIRTFYVTVN